MSRSAWRRSRRPEEGQRFLEQRLRRRRVPVCSSARGSFAIDVAEPLHGGDRLPLAVLGPLPLLLQSRLAVPVPRRRPSRLGSREGRRQADHQRRRQRRPWRRGAFASTAPAGSGAGRAGPRPARRPASARGRRPGPGRRVAVLRLQRHRLQADRLQRRGISG